MEKILEAFSDIADVLPRIDKLKATFGDSPDFQRVLGLIYSDILEFFQRAYKIFRRRAWHIWFAFDWGLFERRFKSILGKLASHCELLDKEAAAIHFSEMKAMRETRRVEDEEHERGRQCRMVQELFAWLTAAEDEQEEYLHQLADRRHSGTCDWILEHDHVYSWIEDDTANPIIWMTGIPGAGKTFLSSLIIDNLRPRTKIASMYYFCGQRSSSGDSCAHILRTLIIQLLRQNLDMAPLVHQAYLQKGSSRSSPSMKKMLKEVLSNVNSSRIVLDGIDECDHSTQKEIVTNLVELQKHVGNACKILFSSRHEPQINKSLAQKTHVPLEGNTAGGLHLYIQHNVEELKVLFPSLDAILFDRVEHRLQRMANGMFLWVRLVVTMLKQQVSDMDFETAIEQLPEGLEEAYGRILSSIQSLGLQTKDRAFKILFWLCVAYRPVKIHEVADGIVLRPGQIVLCKKTRIQNMDRDILEICAPLIQKSQGGILELVHFSAKEYLLAMQSGPFIDITQAHFSLAFSCIVNLTSTFALVPRLSNSTEPDVESFLVEGRYGLQQYGHDYWAEHTKSYLEHCIVLDDQGLKLIEALKTFLPIRKDHPSVLDERAMPDQRSLTGGLVKLTGFPQILRLMIDWSSFKAFLKNGPQTSENLTAQGDWKLHNDRTFLSLINFRVQEVTDRLLKLDPSNLPSHIGHGDFTTFIARTGFICRYQICTHSFDSLHDRDAHETTHTPSFPCLQCDFSNIGFRTSRDLDKHVRRYHMLPEDFEIPATLDMMGSLSLTDTVSSTRNLDRRTGRSRCWNKEGRQVMQRSFHQVMARLESENALEIDRKGQRILIDGFSDRPVDSEPPMCGTTAFPVILEDIREKIEGEQYQTLTEFRDDIRRLSNDPDVQVRTNQVKIINTLCDQELAKIMIGLPDFAIPIVDHPPELHFTNDVLPEDGQGGSQDDIKVTHGHVTPDQAIVNSLLHSRTPYWSIQEEEGFPKLLARYGRDFTAIANSLKTKTGNEVEDHLAHLLDSDNGELSTILDEACAKAHQVSQLDREDISIDNSSTMISTAEDPRYINLPSGDQLPVHANRIPYVQTVAPAIPTSMEGGHPAASIDDPWSTDRSLSVATGNKPKKYKRRPPPRVLCQHCNEYPEGLHNEHSLRKHIGRIHTKQRKVFVCTDVSIDKNFLLKCKPCSKSKRYQSRNNAAKHLRMVHFTEDTPPENLLRWTKEVEEPNPSYRESVPSSSSINSVKGPAAPRQQVQPHTLPDLSTKYGTQKESNRLPELWSVPENEYYPGLTPSPANLGELPRMSDYLGSLDDYQALMSPSDEILFSDVSFDNLLPDTIGSSGGPPLTSCCSIDPSIMSSNRALIRPDQVERLPHLSQYQKLICQDQVNALHEIIHSEGYATKRYEEALNGLRSLSRTLLADLREWRQSSMNGLWGPNIPLSL